MDTSGPLSRFLADDHRRIETLLDLATSMPGSIDRQLYEQFRAGLLRHIGMEEKVLLPAVKRARGAPLPAAQQLHLDHGAIAALLVPTPTSDVIRLLRRLLALHDALEEGRGGVYENCDELLTAAAAAGLVDQLRDFPAVRTAPHNDGPLVERHIVETLVLAGRERQVQET